MSKELSPIATREEIIELFNLKGIEYKEIDPGTFEVLNPMHCLITEWEVPGCLMFTDGLLRGDSANHIYFISNSQDREYLIRVFDAYEEKHKDTELVYTASIRRDQTYGLNNVDTINEGGCLKVSSKDLSPVMTKEELNTLFSEKGLDCREVDSGIFEVLNPMHSLVSNWEVPGCTMLTDGLLRSDLASHVYLLTNLEYTDSVKRTFRQYCTEHPGIELCFDKSLKRGMSYDDGNTINLITYGDGWR